MNASQSAVPPLARQEWTSHQGTGRRSSNRPCRRIIPSRRDHAPMVQAHLRQPVDQSSNTFIHSDSLIEWLSGLDAIRSRNDAGDHTRRIDTRT